MFSNKYIFIYSSVMVVIVAILLALTSTLLKPAQDNNVKMEKMQMILKSANIEVGFEDAIEKYDEVITSEIVLNTKGEVIAEYTNGKFEKGDVRAFDIELKKELQKIEKGNPEDANLPLYVFVNKQDTLFIIPIHGKGLWGPVWGNIALKSDKETIAGVTFDHQGETPGLGAEISESKFQEQFVGKKIFDENGSFVSVKVVKGGVANSNINPMYGVDAVSGGTITSQGVDDMIRECLINYENFLKQ
ncbi:MAG: NADH:ubiquinone reductase (Na(+)-transporting) subunit C [Bacteroidales bacterium]|jgi:Na+-transporting NADH:ubiquinone oxidoreductase subunit C|nr:NADH:ubiquinone reductase (Na(+)-transporting) subunit C [Bacteroidales bacterium]